jgi:single-strand DNA-binding protein
MNFNLIIQGGNLTRDPEISYTPQGTPVCKFSIAVNSGWGDKKKVHFLECVFFGKRAETVSQYLSKGSSVLVTGRLEEQKWESNGEKKSKWQINVSDVTLGAKKGSDQGGDGDFTPPEEKTDLEPF